MSGRIAEALTSVLAERPRRVLDARDRTRAAVLVPLLTVDGEASVLYIRRAQGLPHHQGQVAFPGGVHRAAHDDGLLATALREAEEEIGLAPVDVRPLGALDDVETVSTRFVITPFVGLVPHPYPWRPCPVEVDGMFTVPLRRLTTPEALRRETRELDGRAVTIETCPLGEHVVWGATLRITRNLLALLGTSA